MRVRVSRSARESVAAYFPVGKSFLDVLEIHESSNCHERAFHLDQSLCCRLNS